MLGLKAIRNPNLATLAMLLVLLPVFWVPTHSHRIGIYRVHCTACLLAVAKATILTATAAAIVVLLVRDWRERMEFSPRLVTLPNPSFLGRAPPRSTEL